MRLQNPVQMTHSTSRTQRLVFLKTRDSSNKLAASPAKMAAIARAATRTDNAARRNLFICRVAEGRAKGIPVNETLKPVKLILDLKLVSAPSLLDLEGVNGLWLTYFLSVLAQIPANGAIGKIPDCGRRQKHGALGGEGGTDRNELG